MNLYRLYETETSSIIGPRHSMKLVGVRLSKRSRSSGERSNVKSAIVYGKSRMSVSLKDLKNNVSNSSLATFKFEKNNRRDPARFHSTSYTCGVAGSFRWKRVVTFSFMYSFSSFERYVRPLSASRLADSRSRYFFNTLGGIVFLSILREKLR